jgi:hypothetical protein
LTLEIGLGTAAKTKINVGKIMCEIDDKNRIEELFISSQAFHQTTAGRVQKITAKERFEPKTLETFDPVTRELY